MDGGLVALSAKLGNDREAERPIGDETASHDEHGPKVFFIHVKLSFLEV